MKILELFCGTKSISNVFKINGWETLTVDNNSNFKPDRCMDIKNIESLNIPSGFFPNMIWASPPCQCFSVASISTHWKGGKKAYIPKTKTCKESLVLLDKTIWIINKFNPEFWFIENPRGVMRKVIDKIFKKYGIINYKRVTVTYCRYGDTRMKPTDIWTNNLNWKPKLMCKNGDTCHEAAPRGSKTGTQGLKDSIDRSRIPKELCEEIYHSCNF